MGGIEKLKEWIILRHPEKIILFPSNPVKLISEVIYFIFKFQKFILLVDSAYFWKPGYSIKGLIKLLAHYFAAFCCKEIWVSFPGAQPNYKYLRGKTFVMPTKTLLLEKLEEFNQDYENVRKSIDIAYIGRLTKEKGVYRILEIFKKLSGNLNLAFIGEGLEKESLMSQCKGMKNVKFLEYKSQKEAIEIFSKTRSIILMSHQEGCSMVSKEAVCLGLYVFSYRFLGDSPFYLSDDLVVELKRNNINYNINAIESKLNN